MYRYDYECMMYEQWRFKKLAFGKWGMMSHIGGLICITAPTLSSSAIICLLSPILFYLFDRQESPAWAISNLYYPGYYCRYNFNAYFLSYYKTNFLQIWHSSLLIRWTNHPKKIPPKIQFNKCLSDEKYEHFI